MQSDEHLRAALDALAGLGAIPPGEPRRAVQQVASHVAGSSIRAERDLFNLLIEAVAATDRTAAASRDQLARLAALDAERQDTMATMELSATLERWATLDARLRRPGVGSQPDSGS